MDNTAKSKLCEWFKFEPKILQEWVDFDDTHYYVLVVDGDIYFVRVFSIGDKWGISVDKRLIVYNPYEAKNIDGRPRYSLYHSFLALTNESVPNE